MTLYLKRLVCFFFLLPNMGLLLLTVNHIQNIQLSVGHSEKQIIQISKIQKTYTLLGVGKPETYSQNQKPSKVGYGHYYIPGNAMHEQKLIIKRKTQRNSEINPNQDWIPPGWPVPQQLPHPDSPWLHPTPSTHLVAILTTMPPPCPSTEVLQGP